LKVWVPFGGSSFAAVEELGVAVEIESVVAGGSKGEAAMRLDSLCRQNWVLRGFPWLELASLRDATIR
jgi:hypothetical protein